MKEYLSHYSAALKWNIPNMDQIFGLHLIDKRRSGQIIDITVSAANIRCREKGYISHTCTLPLPRGSVLKRHGLHIASPELLFLELARELDIHHLIFLGLQMCSHPPGKPSKAITSKRKLSSFIEKVSGHNGLPKAERAVKYIMDGSASIMESITFMILTLPNALGGYGLKGACFNYKILLKHETNRPHNQRYRFLDLYYPKSKQSVEYDSFKHHNSPQAQAKDLIREIELERNKVDVLRFSTYQLYNESECEKFALNLASRLGKRIRISSAKFFEAHKTIRSLLPAKPHI